MNKSNYNWPAIKNYIRVVVPRLPNPPLKGKDHAPRVRLSEIVHGPAAGRLDALLPSTHKEVVTIRRRGGYSSQITFVSEEIALGLRLIVEK